MQLRVKGQDQTDQQPENTGCICGNNNSVYKNGDIYKN